MPSLEFQWTHGDLTLKRRMTIVARGRAKIRRGSARLWVDHLMDGWMDDGLIGLVDHEQPEQVRGVHPSIGGVRLIRKPADFG